MTAPALVRLPTCCATNGEASAAVPRDDWNERPDGPNTFSTDKDVRQGPFWVPSATG